MAKECMLSHIKNPYNPFEDFDNWRAWDLRSGYCCLEYVDRLLFISPAFTDEQISEEYENVIDRILKNDPDDYIKVVKGEGYKYEPSNTAPF